MSSLQCPKRVHLEVNKPGLARYSAATQAAFEIGHRVGDIAIRQFGGGQGSYIEYNGGNFSAALARTEELMNSLFRAPVFEATLQHEGVLVREDVLLPDEDDSGATWRVVEVKASTKVKPEHVQDCAVQAWVHLGAGHTLSRIALAHIDKHFVYAGDGHFEGLLLENDLSQQVFDMLPSVTHWVEQARQAVAGPMPEVAPGQQCTSPYECPFLHVCWPTREEGVAFPVTGLGGGRKQLGLWVVNGYRDIREVPPSELRTETQQRIQRVTRAGIAERLPGARDFVKELGYPRFYLDFETIGPPVPIWPGTRPYQTLPIQWSCHVERGPGAMEHAEFLDLSGQPPMRALAEAMIEALESDGAVLMYTTYERGVILGLADMFPDLAPALEAIVERLVDLHPVTRANYYHPDMLGSWSIKAVLPTIAPDMDYAGLEGIHEGTEASAAYLEAIDPETPGQRREAIRKQLLTYCRHDTEAMVRLVQYFEGG